MQPNKKNRTKMKKKALVLSAAICAVTQIMAGGLLTNTNQSVQFVRGIARDAVIAIDGVYSNPAGVAFMGQGIHLGLSLQSIYQKRTIDSRFAGFATEKNHLGQDKRHFDGNAKAPIVPSVQFVYNKDKWSFSGSFAISGGGGKATFPNGLGSFEAAVSMLPLLGKDMGITKYNLNSYMRGRQYYYGVQLGAARKLTDKLSVFAGGRIIYASTNYYGYLSNIKIGMANGAEVPASAYFSTARDQMIEAGDMQKAQEMGMLAGATQDITLNCDQTGWGFTPVIGIDWQPNKHWNFSAKYEFKTRMRLKNEAANSMSANNLAQLDQFRDGKKVPEDIPAMLTLGVQYSPIDQLRINTGFHYYYDKQSRKYEHAEKKLRRGTREILAGAEYDINKTITASAGWQNTNYGLTDAYMKDISFTTSSNSIGVGVAIHLNKKCTLDMGYFQTFYHHYDKTHKDYNDVSNLARLVIGSDRVDQILASDQPGVNIFKGSDRFYRTCNDIAIGLTVDF